MTFSTKLHGATVLCLVVALGIPGAKAGTTNIAVPYSTGGTIYGPGNWSGSPYNGPQIAAAPTNGSGATGIVFADWSGQFEQINPGTTATITTDIALGTSTSVNSLLNTFYGDNNEDGYVTFTDSSGDTATFDLVGGETIRDYNQSVYQNGIAGSDPLTPGLTTQEWWNNGDNGQRLDVQTFILPGTFADTTLTSIAFADNATMETNGYVPDLVLSALQVDTNGVPVSATPEPSSLMLLGTGILGIAGMVRRKLRA